MVLSRVSALLSKWAWVPVGITLPLSNRSLDSGLNPTCRAKIESSEGYSAPPLPHHCESRMGAREMTHTSVELLLCAMNASHKVESSE